MKKLASAAAMAMILTVVFTLPVRAHPAKAVVDLIWKAIGGKSTFERARFVQFTFAAERDGEIRGSRHHTWDRYSGDYVLEWTDAESGDDLKVYFNVESLEGVAVRNGTALAGDEAKAMIDRAYGAFINDTYWLLVPTKLEDYGCRIAFTGHEGQGEESEQLIVLHLFFEDVGLTPGDQYWLYVTHDGHIVRWRFVLESGYEGVYDWKDERDCGMGLVFSTRKVTPDGKRAIVFPEVRFSETMDPAVFEYAGK